MNLGRHSLGSVTCFKPPTSGVSACLGGAEAGAGGGGAGAGAGGGALVGPGWLGYWMDDAGTG